MSRFLLRWVINAIALYAAIFICGGIGFSGSWVGIIWLALIFGLVNAILRPIIKVLIPSLDHTNPGFIQFGDQYVPFLVDQCFWLHV